MIQISGLKEKLRGILPVIFGVLGISAVIKIIQNNGVQLGTKSLAMEAAPMMADSAEESAGFVAERVAELPVIQQPDIALWFLLGGLSAVGIYLVVYIIKEKIKK